MPLNLRQVYGRIYTKPEKKIRKKELKFNSGNDRKKVCIIDIVQENHLNHLGFVDILL